MIITKVIKLYDRHRSKTPLINHINTKLVYIGIFNYSCLDYNDIIRFDASN